MQLALTLAVTDMTSVDPKMLLVSVRGLGNSSLALGRKKFKVPCYLNETLKFHHFCCYSDIAGMLLKSTGIFLDSGLQDSCDEFWASADDSTASDEIRY